MNMKNTIAFLFLSSTSLILTQPLSARADLIPLSNLIFSPVLSVDDPECPRDEAQPSSGGCLMTRDQAHAYCASHQGRLPTVRELADIAVQACPGARVVESAFAGQEETSSDVVAEREMRENETSSPEAPSLYLISLRDSKDKDRAHFYFAPAPESEDGSPACDFSNHISGFTVADRDNKIWTSDYATSYGGPGELRLHSNSFIETIAAGFYVSQVSCVTQQ